MKTLLKPHWIFFFVILPQLLLAGLFFSAVSIIKTLLEPENLMQIQQFGVALAIGILIFGSLCVFLFFNKRKPNGLLLGLSLIIYYFAFLYFYMGHQDMIPWSIPQWMVSQQDIFKYVFTCTMPPLLFGILLLTVHFTPSEKSHNVWKSLLSMAAIPLFWYLFFVVITPMIRIRFWDNEYIVMVVIAVSTVAFIFFLVRTIYILTVKNGGLYDEYKFLIKAFFSIVLPITGLAVNSSGVFEKNVFGDFSHWAFYLIAVCNGFILSVPIKTNPKTGFILFALKSITFSYSFYFFMVFLPFLPLSVIAVIAIGLGFLMLTPSVLFIIHIQELYQDFQKLKQSYSTWKLRLCLILGFMVLPLIMTSIYLKERFNLHNALNYVFEPTLNNDQELHLASLNKVLNNIRQNKQKNGHFIESQIPYLSNYYNWLVLDNLTLSDQKLQLMERIFTGNTLTKAETRESLEKDHQVKIIYSESRTTYDSTSRCWRTWVDLEIQNGRDINFAEYLTKIHLPQGCWVSNYYLWVEGKKKFGLLAEKKTTQWVFNQIRSTNRDPGILYYVGANEVMFRVFPFNPKEIRKTGIEFIHYEPMVLEIDGHKVRMGDPEHPSKIYQGPGVTYIPASIKASLPKVKRRPYVHFILDCSRKYKQLEPTKIKASLSRVEENEHTLGREQISTTARLIDESMSKNLISREGALISFTDYTTHTLSLSENWQQQLKEKTFKGGFFLERAIQKSLVNNYIKHSDTYPVFVVISDKIEESINTRSLGNIPYSYPESDLFYHLTYDQTLNAYSLNVNNYSIPLEEDVKSIPTPEVHVLTGKRNHYFSVNQEGALVVNNFNKISADLPIVPLIEQAFYLAALDQKLNLMPEETSNLWLPIIKGSFSSRVMIPQTSFIVVETEAQERALLAKQKQVLSAKSALDLADEEVQMSEPELFILLLLMMVFVVYKKFKSSRMVVCRRNRYEV